MSKCVPPFTCNAHAFINNSFLLFFSVFISVLCLSLLWFVVATAALVVYYYCVGFITAIMFEWRSVKRSHRFIVSMNNNKNKLNRKKLSCKFMPLHSRRISLEIGEIERNALELLREFMWTLLKSERKFQTFVHYFWVFCKRKKIWGKCIPEQCMGTLKYKMMSNKTDRGFGIFKVMNRKSVDRSTYLSIYISRFRNSKYCFCIKLYII